MNTEGTAKRADRIKSLRSEKMNFNQEEPHPVCPVVHGAELQIFLLNENMFEQLPYLPREQRVCVLCVYIKTLIKQ